jgi:hypothetical protein
MVLQQKHFESLIVVKAKDSFDSALDMGNFEVVTFDHLASESKQILLVDENLPTRVCVHEVSLCICKEGELSESIEHNMDITMFLLLLIRKLGDLNGVNA